MSVLGAHGSQLTRGPVRWRDELSNAWKHRSEGQPAVPRRDDVRRLGQHRPRRLRSGSSTARSTPGSTSSTPPTSTRAGESEEIVGKALAGGRRDNVVLATKVHGTMGDDPNEFGNSRRWIVTRGREQPAAAEDRLDRPLPDPPPRARHRHRRDARRAERPGPRRARSATSAPRRSRRSQIVEAQWVARAARPRAVRLRAAAVLDPRPGDRERRAADLPALRDGRDPVEPARRRLADRALPARTPRSRTSRRARADPGRYDMSLPGNQRKLEAADALAKLAEEAGMTLIEMALAFVIRHPAVTAAIIGPRTMEQLESQLPRRRRRRCPTRCSTGSTRSSRRGRPSTPPTAAGRTRRSSRRRGVDPAGAAAPQRPARRARAAGGLLVRGEERLDRELRDRDVEWRFRTS